MSSSNPRPTDRAPSLILPGLKAPGSVIGLYKLLQKIGEGGFGAVYMAEQEQPVRRKVALKIIKAGMDTSEVIARFESERQALAIMDHPNIARVFDAGSTESGRPYFVMELVKGVPITEFCDRNHFSPEQRLRLFIDVCHAIQHAHHKGVIHRDIKPSNVLVTLHDGTPVVKVIDFGVAKAITQKLTERTLFTAFGQMIGTPAYMSPEQAEMSGLDIDTRSDVYSLGVLLYELLTGTTPLEAKRLREAGYVEMQRLIREVNPPRPSTRLSSLGDSATVTAGNRGLDVKRLVSLLSGDLDWIVMKALAKERNRRYDTPATFAEDVERYLRREAILARPPSAAYKFRKFAERNRVAVAASAAVIAALVAGAAIATWQAVAASRARSLLAARNTELLRANARERQRFDLAMEAVGAFHTGVSEDVLLKQQEFEPLRTRLLGTAAEFYRKLEAQLGDASDVSSKSALAKAYVGLSGAAAAVGSTDQALKDLDRARELYENLTAAAPADVAGRRELVRVLIEISDVHAQRKEMDLSRKAAARAVDVGEELIRAAPDVAENQDELVRALTALACAAWLAR